MEFEDYYKKGILYIENGNYIEAVKNFTKAIEINENDPVVYLLRGFAFSLLVRTKDAFADFSKALELNPSYPEVYYIRGDFHFSQGRFKEAIEDYSKSIKLQKNFESALFKRGYAYSSLGYFKEAIEDYSNAIKLNPIYAEAYNNRGNAYSSLGLFKEAIEDYSNAIKLNPINAEAYHNKGNAYYDLHCFQGALLNFTKAIKLGFIKSYFRRGLTNNYLRLYKDAIIDFSKTLESDPEDIEAYINRSASYSEIKQDREAISDCTKAIELDKSCVLAYNNRAISYMNLNQDSEALANLSKAIEIDKNFNLAYINRALLYYGILKSDNTVSSLFISSITKSYKDTNSFLFLTFKFGLELKSLDKILQIYNLHPENIQYILDHFYINTESLLLNPFDSIISKNDDVNLILNFIKKSERYSKTKEQSIDAVFRYHMGGCLTSYEMLDNFDELSSNQEYYYWLLSSYEIQVNFKDDFESGIEEMLQNQNTNLDNYYIGLAYLLNEEAEKAIQFFKKSNQFLFSKILITYLTENKEEKSKLISQLNQEILEFEFETFELDKKMSFDAYFHYFECKEYIEELKINEDINLIFDTNFTTFQSIFKLNDAAKSELDILDYSLDIKKGIEELYQEFENQFDPSLNLDQTKIQLTKTKEKFKDIFDKLERNIGEGNDAENELRSVIESFAVNSIKFYSLLITYYYAQNKIDKKQAFYLTLFLVKIESDFRDKKLGDAITETYKTGLDTGKTITGNLALKIVLGLVKSGAPKLFEYLKEEDAFHKSETQYYKFKENIIHYFKMEKANQSNKKFEDKFRLIDYFVDGDAY